MNTGEALEWLQHMVGEYGPDLDFVNDAGDAVLALEADVDAGVVRIVDRYRDRAGHHRHRCAPCGFVWEHTWGGNHCCPRCDCPAQTFTDSSGRHPIRYQGREPPGEMNFVCEDEQ
jgi:hypothetical protein